MRVRTRESYEALKIAPGDSNKMVLLFDPIADQTGFVSLIEIFDVGGRTPPNMHTVGQEMFYVLKGEGRAFSGDKVADLRPGDSLLVMPGGWHEVENTGPGKLYCLTFMAPNEGFAELIRAGQPEPLDDEDWAVISGAPRA